MAVALDSLPGRHVRPDDASLLLPLYEAVDRDEIGRVDITLADIDAMLRDPRAVLEKSVLLTHPNGAPLAAMVPSRASTPDACIDLELVVEPGNAGLFDELVARAEQEWAQVPDPPRLELWVTSPSAQRLLVARGYATTATYARFSRRFAASDEFPPDRGDARVRLVEGEAEWPLYHATLMRVFSDSREPSVEAYDEWAGRMVSAEVNDPSQWWLLEVRTGDGNWAPAGVFQCNRQGQDADEAWIKNFGVVPECRGRGLGRYLLQWGLAELAVRGRRRVGLGADLHNRTNALTLYTATGFEQQYSASRLSKQP